MAKYDKLAKEYAKEVARIKNLKERAEKLQTEFDEWDCRQSESEIKRSSGNQYKRADLYSERFEEILQRIDKVNQAWNEYHNAFAVLQYDIDIEYHNVPYSKPREQGIKRFFELVGLK